MLTLDSSIYKQLFLTKRLFALLAVIILLFVAAYFNDKFLVLANLGLTLIMVFAIADCILLFRIQKPLKALRITNQVFSNGDQNQVEVLIESNYPFDITCEVIDEIPFQFQKRNLLFTLRIKAGSLSKIKYELKPVERGSYQFGHVNVFVKSPLKIIKRQLIVGNEQVVKVYPGYLQLKQYQLMAAANRLSEFGVKQQRRIGHSMEFEHIRSYVAGDDQRSVNWKATARSGELMVNNYQDEKSQPVYCIIDKGRLMKMPFEDMTLLDYAINSSLIISSICIQKHDKAGLITFSNKVDAFLPASRQLHQLKKINEILFNQQTAFLESDMEALYAVVRKGIPQRSFLILFTNYETLNSLNRQLYYIRRLAQLHLLLIVFFDNTEIRKVLRKPAKNLNEIYLKSMAEKLEHEKRLIAKQINRFGIHVLYTTPSGLTANTINRYLEFKSRGML